MDIEQVGRGANTFIIFMFEGKKGDQNMASRNGEARCEVIVDYPMWTVLKAWNVAWKPLPDKIIRVLIMEET